MAASTKVAENVAGAWQVMRGRSEGLNRLDLSLEGFWKSFAVVILIIPFTALGMISQSMLVAQDGEAAAALAGDGIGLEIVAFLADWFTFPLVFAALARPLGLGARYVPFIVTRNWASLVIAAMVSIIHAGHIVGLLPAQFATLLLFLAIAVALRFSYVIARTTLSVSLPVALPIVILDFLISLTIWSAFDQLGSAAA